MAKGYDIVAAAMRRFLRGAGGTIVIVVLGILLDYAEVLSVDPAYTLEAGLGVSVIIALDKYVRARQEKIEGAK